MSAVPAQDNPGSPPIPFVINAASRNSKIPSPCCRAWPPAVRSGDEARAACRAWDGPDRWRGGRLRRMFGEQPLWPGSVQCRAAGLTIVRLTAPHLAIGHHLGADLPAENRTIGVEATRGLARSLEGSR